MNGFIYAIRSESGHVKIGWSENPIKRFSKIKTDSPVECQLVGYRPGSLSEECRIHEAFAAYHVRGEWFSDCGPVAAFIGELSLPKPQRVVVARHPENALARWIAENGHTVYSFAALIGTTAASVSRWSSGRVSPSPKFVKAIVGATDGVVAASDLLSWLNPSEAAQ